MKKFICIAAMAMAFLCVEHGNVSAAVSCQLELSMDQAEISPELAKKIIQKASQAVNTNFNALYDDYLIGVVTIDITADGYLVTFADGGMLTVLTEEGI